MKQCVLWNRTYICSMLIAAVLCLCLVFTRNSFSFSDEMMRQLKEGALVCGAAACVYGILAFYPIVKFLSSKNSSN